MAEKPVERKHRGDQTAVQMTPEQWKQTEELFVKLSEAKERVDGIVSVCVLDDVLERLLRAVMTDSKSVDDLMNDGQVLQPFSTKLRLAYALDLIPEAVRNDLYFLNKIRNVFAHEADVTSLDKAPVCDLCRNLSTTKHRDGIVRPPKTAYQMAVYGSIYFLSREIGLKERERASRQGQSIDSVESRYTDYLDGLYEESHKRVK